MRRLLGRLAVGGGSSMPGGSRVFSVRRSAMCLVELFGAVRAFEIVSFTGNGKSGDGHKQDGE